MASRATRICAGLSVGCFALLAAGCGGDDDYANKPRPPAPINVTASIGDRGLSVSPTRIGAGPVVFIITNQTSNSHRVTLAAADGETTPQRDQSIGPINPRDTATLKVNVAPGRYEVRTAGDGVRAGRLTVGKERRSAQNDLLQP